MSNWSQQSWSPTRVFKRRYGTTQACATFRVYRMFVSNLMPLMTVSRVGRVLFWPFYRILGGPLGSDDMVREVSYGTTGPTCSQGLLYYSRAGENAESGAARGCYDLVTTMDVDLPSSDRRLQNCIVQSHGTSSLILTCSTSYRARSWRSSSGVACILVPCL